MIEVFPGPQKPYYVKAETLDKGVYVRLGRNTLRATSEMIEELRWRARGRSYDGMLVYHSSFYRTYAKKGFCVYSQPGNCKSI